MILYNYECGSLLLTLCGFQPGVRLSQTKEVQLHSLHVTAMWHISKAKGDAGQWMMRSTYIPFFAECPSLDCGQQLQAIIWQASYIFTNNYTK